jgi:twitching motility protein PilU
MTHSTDAHARGILNDLATRMVAAGGSDLFLAHDFPPSMKVNGRMQPLADQRLDGTGTAQLAHCLMNERQRDEFAREQECNFAVDMPGVSRFRVNVYVQQGQVALVLRTIAAEIPNFQALRLPDQLKALVMEQRGLVLVVGATGSGKSTSLAAMIDHRNSTCAGHIVTVEDPVEYAHRSKLSLVSHREVGVDTQSWKTALKNALRQAPDVILIGEIRDAETMEHALTFAETGHLCLATLHANSASHVLERIVNFFPDERRPQLLMDLSANLKGVVAQRLVRREDGAGRVAAIEIMLNTPSIAERIAKGELHDLKPIMAKSREQGMRTFDWALFELYNDNLISYDEAVRHADSANEVRLNIKLKSARGEPASLHGRPAPAEAKELTPEDVDRLRREEMLRQQERRRQLEDQKWARLMADKATAVQPAPTPAPAASAGR